MGACIPALIALPAEENKLRANNTGYRPTVDLDQAQFSAPVCAPIDATGLESAVCHRQKWELRGA